MRNPLASFLLTLMLGCSSGPEPSSSSSPGAGRPRSAAPDAGTSPAAKAGPELTYSGSFRGQSVVPDGGPSDGATPWQGEGRVRVEARGDDVEGLLEAQDLHLRVSGNIAGDKLRAWLRPTGAGPRFEGVMVGERSGDSLSGSVRLSGPTGLDVREGRFEARR